MVMFQFKRLSINEIFPTIIFKISENLISEAIYDGQHKSVGRIF